MSDLHCKSGPYFSENTALVVAIPEYSRIIRCTEYSPYTVQCNYGFMVRASREGRLQ